MPIASVRSCTSPLCPILQSGYDKNSHGVRISTWSHSLLKSAISASWLPQNLLLCVARQLPRRPVRGCSCRSLLIGLSNLRNRDSLLPPLFSDESAADPGAYIVLNSMQQVCRGAVVMDLHRPVPLHGSPSQSSTLEQLGLLPHTEIPGLLPMTPVRSKMQKTLSLSPGLWSTQGRSEIWGLPSESLVWTQPFRI